MNFLNTLAWWQWTILAAVPPAIILLYFLKLKRQPIEVPSTYLWSRAIEDLHVNSIWQRLRQSLLLFLQLLLLLLIMFALVRPGWRGSEMRGGRYIFLLDTSASMSATDLSPTRLDRAKDQISAMIDQMKSDEVGMIISFSNVARVEQPFTDNRRLLQTRLAQIRPTNRNSDIGEALRAASGLANPGRTSQDATDFQVADALPATLYIFSDGGFTAVPDFNLGNLEPKYTVMGTEQPNNVGITQFTTERNPEKPGQTQAFARVENYSDEERKVEVTLLLNDTLLDAVSVEIPPNESSGVPFELSEIESGVLKLKIDAQDDLEIDNVAYAAISTPRLAKVLFVSPGNDALEFALQTTEVDKVAEVTFGQPAMLDTKEYEEKADSAAFDLVIYDRCSPKKMPQANTLFIGAIPPGDAWTAGEVKTQPFIIDTDRIHPITQLIEMANVKVIFEGFAVQAPPGGSTLMSADIGPIFAVAPRGGFEDAVLGFDIVSNNEKGETETNTDWPIRRSFPVFVLNVVRYFGGNSGVLASPSVRPGETVELRTRVPVDRIRVTAPNGERQTLERGELTAFPFTQTNQLGVYEIFEGDAKEVSQRFTVNLFDSRESDLKPGLLEIGHEKITGTVAMEPTRIETWKWILLAVLGVLLLEWYIYNRRVYL